jgi:hypothetical protein
MADDISPKPVSHEGVLFFFFLKSIFISIKKISIYSLLRKKVRYLEKKALSLHRVAFHRLANKIRNFDMIGAPTEKLKQIPSSSHRA